MKNELIPLSVGDLVFVIGWLQNPYEVLAYNNCVARLINRTGKVSMRHRDYLVQPHPIAVYLCKKYSRREGYIPCLDTPTAGFIYRRSTSLTWLIHDDCLAITAERIRFTDPTFVDRVDQIVKRCLC